MSEIQIKLHDSVTGFSLVSEDVKAAEGMRKLMLPSANSSVSC